MWCRRQGEGYEVGARFILDDDLHRLRMVEQVCHIEHYRSQMEKTIRNFSSGESVRSR